MMIRILVTIAVIDIGCAELAFSAEQPDKRGFHLFRPVPRDLMRDMSTDRPDQTESPFTVDAGHFQIESDLVNFTRDRQSDSRFEQLSIGTLNLKAGLLNNADLQVVLEPLVMERTVDTTTGFVVDNSGFGDIELRLKINLWGNDGGKTAFALLPSLKLPTNQNNLGNHSVEGGVLFPFAMELPRGWGMGAMTGFSILKKDGARGHYTELINSITFGRDLTEKLGGYMEFFAAVNSQKSREWVGQIGAGMTYGVTENVQLDGGVNFGVTRWSPDINPFVGFSVRF